MLTLLASLAAIDHVTPQRIQEAVVFMVALILSVAVHEYGHARVADHLGDRLPRMQGRVTLNPLQHLDVWGTIVFPLLMIVSGAGMLGWGRPVRVSLRMPRYRHGLGPRAAHFLIAAAGPLMNVLFALVLSAAMVLALRGGMRRLGGEVLAPMIALNLGLAAFNLLPCPPLDGGALLTSVLGPDHAVSRFLSKYGPILFIGLLLSGVLAMVMSPAVTLSGLWLGRLFDWAL
ncbi:MAG TPA: site-2 protease family protein [Polyangia bacterium]|jgi:Zn-dependent protease|nr:site-2 protease family protein [Polyangia bacterium]